MKSKKVQISPAELMIFINYMILTRAPCSVQDRASRAPFSSPIIMKIIIPIHPKLLKKEGFLEEANYSKVINKKILESIKILITTSRTFLLSLILIITRYWSIMIATLMEYPAHKDPQSNY